ncbi:hypothetical protein [Streptomyces marianii]|uniref:FtsK domain-containing protein n=1 Tax=Streptomyces marianii TaxID=1817406 RepID=A0A5R9DT03_9ACTN|nr:hypothetical protein [Streptomyces marianii]TLQ39265.1 hypothetical protein FEF34_38370 [Streptomyces marianii]
MNPTRPRTPRLPRPDVHLTRGPGRRAAQRSPHPLIGLGADDAPVHLTPDDGHALLTAPAGMGTTELLRTLGVQALAAGRQVDILDVSGCEHLWAQGREHVTYLDDPDQLHRHLMGLAHQARGRSRAGVPGPPRLLLVENDGTTEVLRHHHADPRPNGVPLDALTAVLAHGRPVGMQVVLACRELPPPLRHLRSLFTTRLVIDPDGPGADSTHAPPSSPAGFRPGLWQHINAAGRRLVQAARITEQDAARFIPTRPAARDTKESHR